MSSPYRRFILTPEIGSLVGLAFAGLGYGIATRITQDPRPAKGPRNPLAHRAHAKGKDAGKGRTNGMPWDGTSPVSAPAEIDCHKAPKPDGRRWLDPTKAKFSED